MKNMSLVLLATSVLLVGCGDDDDGMSSMTHSFTVSLENVAPVRPFTSGAVFNMPVGESVAGPATPGKKYQFTIQAGRKQRLSFATMLAATNDLFFGPNGDGIALYDAAGDPISGDVTDQIYLWNAGTEINEEPRVGPTTVTNQGAPNTGPDENGKVMAIGDTTEGISFDYPAVSEVMKVSVQHVAGTEFEITIENVSSATTLQTSQGDFPAPLSPGVWVVHNGKDPLYTVGMPDRGQGLESIAEDGNPAMLGTFVSDNVGITFPASPGVWVVHKGGTKPLFVEGKADYGDGLENIAEDGNPAMLGGSAAMLNSQRAGVFNMPVGSQQPGPIVPGSKYQFEFDAAPGDALSFAAMLAATNDVFFASKDTGIPLYDASDRPLNKDITSQIYLWDAGTEANEAPGIGPNTVTNQLAPNTGTNETMPVQLLSEAQDGYTYPAVSSILKVSITSK